MSPTSKLLPVPQALQLANGYCLPACVEMVLAYWGIKRSQKRLARQLGTIKDAGTSGSRLHRLASRSVEVVYTVGEIDDLKDAIANQIPPIALVHTGQLSHWQINTPHAVVVVGLHGDSIFINDPAVSHSPIECSLGDFYLAWDEMENLFATIRPKST